MRIDSKLASELTPIATELIANLCRHNAEPPAIAQAVAARAETAVATSAAAASRQHHRREHVYANCYSPTLCLSLVAMKTCAYMRSIAIARTSAEAKP